MTAAGLQALPGLRSLQGESPFWHPVENALYWVDIRGRRLERYEPARELRSGWALDGEPGCCAPVLGGGLLLAQRDGLWHFDTESGRRHRLATAPYDAAVQRFNDGKADALGRFWVGTTYEPCDKPGATLYRYSDGRLEPVAQDITTSNGLAWSPDARTLYWSDTTAHAIHALDFDLTQGTLSNRRVFAQFESRRENQPLSAYGGRPDGAAVDVEGCYWVAMFEGARLLRLRPDGTPAGEWPLPVRCPTMPCFGGTDLRTLFVTSARVNRPAEELALQPMAGAVLHCRVDVQGLPASFVHL